MIDKKEFIESIRSTIDANRVSVCVSALMQDQALIDEYIRLYGIVMRLSDQEFSEQSLEAKKIDEMVESLIVRVGLEFPEMNKREISNAIAQFSSKARVKAGL